MKWSRDHVLTWYFMTEFMLTVDLHRFINSYWVYIEVIRHQTQHSRLYSYWICTKFQVNSPSDYKRCPANGPKWTLISVILKSRSLDHGEDPAIISSGVIALFVFLVLALWWPSQESHRTKMWSVQSSDLGVHMYKVSVNSPSSYKMCPANGRWTMHDRKSSHVC
jgi:hypothetical protein